MMMGLAPMLSLSLRWSPDGRVLASGGMDGRVLLWDPVAGERLRTLLGPDRNREVFSLAWSPDGGYLLVGFSGVVRIYDLASGEESDRLEGHQGVIFTLEVAPDGQRIITGGSDGTIRVWAPRPVDR